MLERVDIEAFSILRTDMPVIDVRSPKEYAHGHIPTAINLPVFSDDERAVVGTLYKKKGREVAMAKALSITQPKREKRLQQVLDISDENGSEVLVHCWRGGMRSGKFAEFLSENGIGVKLLTGGYKAYRSSIHDSLRLPWKLIILGGMTGTGKTDILLELKVKGHQVICLESIARHKGSAFGRLGQDGQPTTEQFQNDLWEEWSTLDISKPVILEDESQAIGSVRIPDELFAEMRTCPVINLQLIRSIRAERLVAEYGKFDIADLKKSVLNISRRLGHERSVQAVKDLDEGNLLDVAISTLQYYDKAYTFGLNKRNKDTVETIVINSGDAKDNVKIVEDCLPNIEARSWKR
ncbi:MAG TPA: tRNA 2-selenouridine(34) synthase MnmH [Flavobacteriales bacterium]|nr:tRNA 2-selenouridine(34) synthase MnmH [Flavobacteriales bacterium]